MGDLVMVTNCPPVPMWGVDKGKSPLIDIPPGTMGVIMGILGHGHYSVITGIGLIMIHDSHLRRLGMTVTERED